MIINYPTGLYRSILPSSPSDAGSVTFTISNNEPPRTNLIFPKVPSISPTPSSNIPIDIVKRRDHLGALVFTTSSAVRDEIGNSNRTYEIGQVLEFENNETKSIDPMIVSNKSHIRHDINNVDYESIGISTDDLKIINSASIQAQNDLTISLNNVKILRANSEVVIGTQQKVINDVNRAILAMDVMYAQSNDNDIKIIIDKLKLKLSDATAVLDSAISDANQYAAEAEIINNDLRAVSTILQ